MQSSKIEEGVLSTGARKTGLGRKQHASPRGSGREEMGTTAEVVALSPLGTIDSFETLYIAHMYMKLCIQIQGVLDP